MKYRDWLKSLPADEQREIQQASKESLQELTIATIRAAAGKTQAEMASELRVSQTQISKLERQKDMRLSTLRKYIEAAGGTLEVRFKMPTGTVTVGDLTEVLADAPIALWPTPRASAEVCAPPAAQTKVVSMAEFAARKSYRMSPLTTNADDCSTIEPELFPDYAPATAIS